MKSGIKWRFSKNFLQSCITEWKMAMPNCTGAICDLQHFCFYSSPITGVTENSLTSALMTVRIRRFVVKLLIFRRWQCVESLASGAATKNPEHGFTLSLRNFTVLPNPQKWLWYLQHPLVHGKNGRSDEELPWPPRLGLRLCSIDLYLLSAF